ncbi:MAG: UbiA family prenyltransferase [Fimbriimonadaceae bacterium]|nr:UbiA family prenyltransferase [Fimbriimonadaceae bacterium]
MKSLRTFLEMVKIEHSIFALPFAMIGMMWAARGWPGWDKFLWIVIAMVSCRTAAMAFNRIADRHMDSKNPRTSMRAIPAGLLALRTANLYLALSILLFLVAAAMLNPLALMLSPVALLFTLGYSLTKRFTWLCHIVLGFSLGIAPAAAWIGVRGSLNPAIVALTVAVTCWTAGFDIIYSLQDDDFDRDHGLQSIPARFGRPRALMISRLCHVVTVISLVAAGILFNTGALYLVGVGFATALLVYEQSLVKSHDLSKVNMAFFTLNGYVSIGVFLFAFLDLWLLPNTLRP